MKPFSGLQVTERLPSLVYAHRIWNRGKHNAFTDLIRYKGLWYCAFREAGDHMRGFGKVRIIASKDFESWTSVRLFSERDVDLRDPKLSITPSKKLMLLMGGTRFKDGRYVGRQPRVAFSQDGFTWTTPEQVLSEGDWLWRVAWFEGRAYGITYRIKSKTVWEVFLVAGKNGTDYDEVCKLAVPGKPNEATIRFFANGEAMILIRREGRDKKGWIGRSRRPYEKWMWHSAGFRLGGPNFIILSDGSAWAATRLIKGNDARTVIARIGNKSLEPVLELPSGGDCSYPGLVYHNGFLWTSYYSSHEGKTAIYCAKIKL